MRLFDLHCDTLTECYRKNESLDCCTGDVDLTRASCYEQWCQVFAIWLSDTPRGETAWRYCLRALIYARRQAQLLADRFAWVSTRDELINTINSHRTVGVLGVENGSALSGNPKRVRVLSLLGVRVLTLTWNGSNELGNGCMSGEKGGLTPCGKAVLAQLEQHHITADASHLNEAGFWDVAHLSTRPFIASHSVSASIQPHVRNLTDAQFRAVCNSGGVVGVTLCGEQLGEQSFDALYRHVSRYLSLGGERHVAIGFDLDGTQVSSEFNGIEAALLFADYMLKRGLCEKTVNAILFDNAHRFFLKVLP